MKKTLGELFWSCDFFARLNNEPAKNNERGDYQTNCRGIEYDVTPCTSVGEARSHQSRESN